MPIAYRHWLANPRRLLARLRYALWERRNPDAPWLCPDTVAFLEKNLRPRMNALEFGSGRSTPWIAARVAALLSVEHDARWADAVARNLRERGVRNVDYRVVPLDHPESDPERETYEPLPAYVAVARDLPDRSLHFAFVDGHYRTHCVRTLVPKIAPGGILLVDDLNLWPSAEALPVPTDWTVVHAASNGLKSDLAWKAP